MVRDDPRRLLGLLGVLPLWGLLALAPLTGASLFLVDQWREWHVALWWWQGTSAPVVGSSGLGAIPPTSRLFWLPLVMAGLEPGPAWLLPYLLLVLAILVTASRHGHADALAVALLGFPGVIWTWFGISGAFAYAASALGWWYLWRGRFRSALAWTSLGAACYYAALPAWLVAIGCSLARARQDPRWGRTLAVAGITALSLLLAYGLAATGTRRFLLDFTRWPQALLFLLGGPWGAAGVGVLLLLGIWRGPRRWTLLLLAQLLVAATGIAPKRDYWGDFYLWQVLGLTLAGIYWSWRHRRSIRLGGWLYVLGCVLATAVLIPAKGEERPTTYAVLHPIAPEFAPAAPVRIELSWRRFRTYYAVAATAALAGERVAPVRWAWEYAHREPLRRERLFVATFVPGPWCAREACTWWADETSASTEVTVQTAWWQWLAPLRAHPRRLRLVGEGCRDATSPVSLPLLGQPFDLYNRVLWVGTVALPHTCRWHPEGLPAGELLLLVRHRDRLRFLRFEGRRPYAVAVY